MADAAKLAAWEAAKLPVYRSISETTSAYASQHQGMVPMAVRYKGTSAINADIAVAAGGDITFRHDLGAGLTADTSIGTAGVIDCSTPPAANDTFGELVDIINASANWEAILIDALRSYSTDNTLITLSANTGVFSPGGLKLLADPAEGEIFAGGTPRILTVGIGHEWEDRVIGGSFPMTFDERRSTPKLTIGQTGRGLWRKINRCTGIAGNTTFGSGTTTLEFWTEAPDGTSRQIAAGIPTAATATAWSWPPVAGQYIEAPAGHRLIALITNSAADITAASLAFYGSSRRAGEVKQAY